MKLKKLFSLLLVLLLAASVFALTALADEDETPVEYNGCPYYITVNRQTCTVTVYTYDENDCYTIPVKAMVCATGREGYETPTGTYELGTKYEWINMYDEVYVRYACWFEGQNYFQSAGYNGQNEDGLIADDYNAIGSNMTYGSVRLQLADVKWIYDNCAEGTLVTVYDSDDPGPLGYAEKAVDEITDETNNGWDPTDPSNLNPWKYDGETLVLNDYSLTMKQYDIYVLQAAAINTSGTTDIVWTSSDSKVAKVENGKVTAVAVGTADIIASCGDMKAVCKVTVESRPEGDIGMDEPFESNGQPYMIRVNTKTDTVTVFGLDDDGYYTVPVKVMICSTGKEGCETPLGTYAIGVRFRWLSMVDNSWGQYASGFNGNILFHSICYTDSEPDTLITREYNDLGTNVSLGCVRLQVIDAKWIYDNCGDWTIVSVYQSDYPGPLGYGEKAVAEITPEMDNGWDPTDPDENNPWKNINPTSITLDKTELALDSYSSAKLTATVAPAEATAPVTFTTSDAAVATVDNNGVVTSQGNGECTVTASCLGLTAECKVTVSGTWLTFKDLDADEWYIPYIISAVERGLFSGHSEDVFAPDETMTRAMLVQVLYNMSGETFDTEDVANPFEDVPESEWYYTPVLWAYSEKIVEGVSDTEFAPDEMITREELCVMLHRYYVNYMQGISWGLADYSKYDDADLVSDWASEAVSFMLGNGIITGVSDTELAMNEGATRAQACAIFCRFADKFLSA